MRSMACGIDGHSIAAQVRMERQAQRRAKALKTMVLVEGGTDIKRFSKFFDSGKSVVIPCSGRPNVLEAVDILINDDVPGIVGLIDCDFDEINGNIVNTENVIVSSNHDFDIDIFTTSALKHVLDEVADISKIIQFNSHVDILEEIFRNIKDLSVLRYINEKYSIGYKLSELRLDSFFDGRSIDIDHLVDDVFRGRVTPDATKDALKRKIQAHRDINYDLYHLTNGHDVAAALGIALQDRFGSRRPSHTWGREVEMHVRLAIRIEHLSDIGLTAKLICWENENSPFKILDTIH